MSPLEITNHDYQITWAVCLLVGFPLAMILLGEIVHHCRRSGHQMANPFGHVRILILPPLAIYLLLTCVVRLDASELFPRLALTGFLLGLIYTMLTFVKAVLFVDSSEGSWRHKMPRILVDLIRLTLVMVGSLFVLSAVWGQNLGQMLTAFGVGSIVIGLALQEPMGNVFSGIFLLLERPVQVGDWIEIDGKTGEVAEINWRSVHLVTRLKELIVVPNSVLAKGQFKNFSRPGPMLSQTLEIGFSYDDPPNKVKRVLENIVRQTPGVLQEPPPSVQTRGYGDYCINYIIRFYLTDYTGQFDLRDELLTRIWYAARRESLTIPYPVQTHIQVTPEQMAMRQKRVTAQELTESLQALGLAQQTEITNRLEQVTVRSFGRGEIIIRQGQKLDGLHLIVSGRARLSLQDETGCQQDVGQLGPGEFFGERAIISSQTSEMTIAAIEDLEILILNGDLLHTALESSPRAIREIGNVIQSRDRDLRARRGSQRAA